MIRHWHRFQVLFIVIVLFSSLYTLYHVTTTTTHTDIVETEKLSSSLPFRTDNKQTTLNITDSGDGSTPSSMANTTIKNTRSRRVLLGIDMSHHPETFQDVIES